MDEDEWNALFGLADGGPPTGSSDGGQTGGSSGPDGGAPEQTGRPIGVPEGYVAAYPVPPSREQRYDEDARGRPRGGYQVDVPGWTREVDPLYFKGYEFAPAAWSPGRIAGLQRAMYDAGIFGPKTRFQIGVWDRPSVTAFTSLLTNANASGIRWESALSRWQQTAKVTGGAGGGFSGSGGGGGGGGGPARAPLQLRRSNPMELAEIADTIASEKVLGRKLTDAEKQQFVRAFLTVEEKTQRDAYAGRTVTDPPDPSVLAEQQLRKGHEVEATGHDFARVFDMFLRIIGENE